MYRPVLRFVRLANSAVTTRTVIATSAIYRPAHRHFVVRVAITVIPVVITPIAPAKRASLELAQALFVPVSVQTAVCAGVMMTAQAGDVIPPQIERTAACHQPVVPVAYSTLRAGIRLTA